jgi:hypothetical protein
VPSLQRRKRQRRAPGACSNNSHSHVAEANPSLYPGASAVVQSRLNVVSVPELGYRSREMQSPFSAPWRVRQPGLGLANTAPRLTSRTCGLASVYALAWSLATGLLSLSCQLDARSSKDAVGIVGKGVVNSPSNKSLRFDIIRFGLRQFCDELLHGGAPIRLSDDQPVIGRYFATHCEAESLDEPGRRTIIARFEGHGFAYSALTGRLGFRAAGLIELSPDFRLHESGLYVYFRPVQVDTSDFKLLLTEQELTRHVAEFAHIDENDIGQKIINTQLGRGFTVIRYDADGNSDFALGLVAPGERPFLPFLVRSSPRQTLANGRTEIFPGQQDYVGKLRVPPGDKLVLTLALEGASSADALVVPAADGTATIERYLSHPGPAVPNRAVFQAEVGTGAPLRSELVLPAGDYYLVLDHTDRVGTSKPTPQALPARIDYLLQVGE